MVPSTTSFSGDESSTEIVWDHSSGDAPSSSAKLRHTLKVLSAWATCTRANPKSICSNSSTRSFSVLANSFACLARIQSYSLFAFSAYLFVTSSSRFNCSIFTCFVISGASLLILFVSLSWSESKVCSDNNVSALSCVALRTDGIKFKCACKGSIALANCTVAARAIREARTEALPTLRKNWAAVANRVPGSEYRPEIP